MIITIVITKDNDDGKDNNLIEISEDKRHFFVIYLSTNDIGMLSSEFITQRYQHDLLR